MLVNHETCRIWLEQAARGHEIKAIRLFGGQMSAAGIQCETSVFRDETSRMLRLSDVSANIQLPSAGWRCDDGTGNCSVQDEILKMKVATATFVETSDSLEVPMPLVLQNPSSMWRCSAVPYLVFLPPRCFRESLAPVRSDLEHWRIDTQVLAVPTPWNKVTSLRNCGKKFSDEANGSTADCIPKDLNLHFPRCSESVITVLCLLTVLPA
jgi:hypothetical protein